MADNTNKLQKEIDEVMGHSEEVSSTVKIDVLVHTTNLDMVPTDVKTLDVMSDYHNSITDEITITFMMGLGTFFYDVLPHKDNLEISITKTSRGIIRTERYKLLILNNLDAFNTGRYSGKDYGELNKETELRIVGQCLNRTAEALMTGTVDGIYRRTTVKDLILGLTISEVNKVKVNGFPLDLQVSMYEPDNTRVFSHIVIPTGTKLLDLSTFIQDSSYGVYNGDIGVFITKDKEVDVLYIYPLHHNKLPNQDNMEVIVVGTGSMLSEQSGQTHLLKDNVLRILVGSSSAAKDDGEVDLNNVGVGYVMVDPMLPMFRPVDVTDDSIMISSDELNIRQQLKEKSDGMIKLNRVDSTVNEFKLRSSYLNKNTYSLLLTWKESDSDLIHPGMTVTYMMINEQDDVVRRKGVISQIMTAYNVTEQTVSSKVNLLLERDGEV